MKLGIAGLGAAGAHMLGAALHHPRVTVQAVADIDPILLDALNGRVDGRYPSFEALCDDPSVDVAYIASPTELHVAQALIAFAAGKDVIIEKPMSIDLAGARRAADAAADAGRVLIVGHSMSYEPYARAARDAAEDAGLGRAVTLVLHEETSWMQRPRLPEELDEAIGGGPVLRQGAHLVDVARYMTYGAPFNDIETRGLVATGTRCHGSFVSTMTAGEVQVVLVYNGYVGLPAGDEAATSHRPEARKRQRNLALLTEALARVDAGDLPAQTRPSLRRFLFVYEHGQITVDNEHVDVVLADGRTRSIPTDELPSGRHALLDEMIAARAGTAPTHDSAWGFENLRVCLEMVAATAYHNAANGRILVGGPTVGIPRTSEVNANVVG